MVEPDGLYDLTKRGIVGSFKGRRIMCIDDLKVSDRVAA